MSEPKRIQRKRSKGWRMPQGAIYVGRPSRYGNDFRVGTWLFDDDHVYRPIDAAWAVALFREEMANWNHDTRMRWLAPLRGHDLACWCPLDQPCHADVLIELANR